VTDTLTTTTTRKHGGQRKLFYHKCFCTLTCMCKNIFGKIIFFALRVFLCARVLRPACARTQLRGNFGYRHLFFK